jgi:glycosyltransferase involved in cell wall biosynthesis
MSKPLDNWNSGSGHHLDELIRAVLDRNDGSFEFTLVHYRKSDNPVYSRVRELIVPRNPFAASRAIAKERFDIVHYSPLSVFAPIWGVRARKTATVHGIEEVLYPEGYSPVHRIHDTVIQPMYMRRMDGIATVSQTGIDYFAEHYRIKRERMFITTNGISGAYKRVPGSGKDACLRAGISTPFILHISKYSKRKNPVGIMSGFARFAASATGKGYTLVCAGKGWDGDEAKKIALNEGILDRYVATGFISESNAIGLLNEAAAFVFPSFAEGFGMPNVEAMSCGCPVVTSSIFAIPEIVGDAAVTVSSPYAYDEIADGLTRIVGDETFRKELIDKGLERSKLYRWDSSADAILSYWKTLACGE